MADDTPQPLARLDPAPLATTRALLDLAIAAWLDAKGGKSGSERTRRAYADTLGAFRAELQRAGLDLDSAAEPVALAAQGWAGRGEPAPATYNHRLAVLSSFYRYAGRQGLLNGPNPIERVERRTVQEYSTAEALDARQVRRMLDAIDRSTPAGARDYALLLLALTTGRRLAEIAALRWRDVNTAGDRVVVTFRAKGAKVMRDALDPRVGRALLGWLHRHYGAELGRLDPDAPIWPALQDTGKSGKAGAPLSPRRIQDISIARLGVHFHALRHTFARAMENAGAKVSEIQGRLGHSSLQTTGRYLAALAREENAHAGRLAELFMGEGD